MKLSQKKQSIIIDGEVVSDLLFIIDQDNPDSLEVHQEVYKWSPSIYKEFLIVFESIKEALKDTPVNKVCTVCPETRLTPLVPKYWERAGFTTIENREILGHKVLFGEMEV